MKKYIGAILLITMNVAFADVDFRADFWQTTKRLLKKAKNEVSTQHIKNKYEEFIEYADRYHKRALQDKQAGPTAKSSEPSWLEDFYNVIEGKKATPVKVKAKPTPKKKAPAKKPTKKTKAKKKTKSLAKKAKK